MLFHQHGATHQKRHKHTHSYIYIYIHTQHAENHRRLFKNTICALMANAKHGLINFSLIDQRFKDLSSARAHVHGQVCTSMFGNLSRRLSWAGWSPADLFTAATRATSWDVYVMKKSWFELHLPSARPWKTTDSTFLGFSSFSVSSWPLRTLKCRIQKACF